MPTIATFANLTALSIPNYVILQRAFLTSIEEMAADSKYLYKVP